MDADQIQTYAGVAAGKSSTVGEEHQEERKPKCNNEGMEHEEETNKQLLNQLVWQTPTMVGKLNMKETTNTTT